MLFKSGLVKLVSPVRRNEIYQEAFFTPGIWPL